MRRGDAQPPVVEYGRLVSIEYTLRLDDGSVSDSNVGAEPLVFRQGMETLPAALEEALEGLAVGARTSVTLPPAKAFGEPDPQLRTEARLDQIPEEARRVGARIGVPDSEGRTLLGRVLEIRGDAVTVDLNHPAAGETAHFDVKILAVD